MSRGGPLPSVKEAHLAGRWYPGNAAELERSVRAMLDDAGPPRPGVVALLVPHAAYHYSGPIAARGFARAGSAFRRAVVLAPSHFSGFQGAALLPMAGYRTPLGVMTVDAEGSAVVARSPLVRPNPAVYMREHAVEVQLPMLQTVAPGCTLVALLVGSLDPGDAEALADAVRPLLGADTLLVASSDLTHFGRRFDYLPVPATDATSVAAAVRRLDDGALDRIVARDADGFARWVDETGVTVCGHHAIEVVLRALPPDARGERVAYGTSLDVTGEFEHTVSYAAVTFTAGSA